MVLILIFCLSLRYHMLLLIEYLYLRFYTDEEIERCYEEFYEDVHTKFLKFGEIINFKVLDSFI
ncbi:hypothetical protein RchiOBHm_Chr6g0272521 [Rosa chinensis]|uniref:Uncharacterized protein n=1 Tax=Rosa chinensis TaxID=74649 RepID=A0A2P6PR97_ROSCH|nr:hypothetical protein RchiOBHm_Chr6g0272521 [Rosa chinensis]